MTDSIKAARELIAAQTKEFLAGGGEIDKIGVIIHKKNGNLTQAEHKAEIKRASALILQNQIDRRKSKP